MTSVRRRAHMTVNAPEGASDSGRLLSHDSRSSTQLGSNAFAPLSPLRLPRRPSADEFLVHLMPTPPLFEAVVLGMRKIFPPGKLLPTVTWELRLTKIPSWPFPSIVLLATST